MMNGQRMAARVQDALTQDYSDDEQRDDHGRWTGGETVLHTMNGSKISRAKGGVGKDIGGRLYLHKNYAADVIGTARYAQATALLRATHPDFTFNAVCLDKKAGTVRFDEAPQFDTDREPRVGRMVTVNPDTGIVSKVSADNQSIWHHKWEWVKDDYPGFNVSQSKGWSAHWLVRLPEPAHGSSEPAWQAQLAKHGIKG